MLCRTASDLQPHSRSLAIVTFDTPYTISYYPSVEIMSLSCIISKISIISKNSKRSHDRDHIRLRDQLSSRRNYYYHNHFTALWTLSGTTRVSRYQKKHSPTHIYSGYQSSVICFLHLLRSVASYLFNLHA